MPSSLIVPIATVDAILKDAEERWKELMGTAFEEPSLPRDLPDDEVIEYEITLKEVRRFPLKDLYKSSSPS